MHAVEKFVFAVRHNQFLERAHWLWTGLRPAYDWASSVVARKGLERIINGTDRLLLAPRWRMVSEVYEPEVWDRLVSQVKPGDVIADVGAHIGLYTMALARRVGTSGRVVAFEPDPSNFFALKQHVELNGLTDRVELRETAVGNSTCRIGFGAHGTSESAIYDAANASSNPEQQTVQCVSLDEALSEGRLDILKIDVEGYEEKVILGAQGILNDESRRPRAVFIEVHPYVWPQLGTTSKSFLDLLSSCNYRVEDIVGKPVEQIDKYGEVVAYSY